MTTDKIDLFASDIEKASKILDTLKKPICVLGSSRNTKFADIPDQAEQIGYELAKAGFSVITGGGPGLMEAVNKGAQRGGGTSVGICVKYPNFMIDNPYMDAGYQIVVSSVAARKHLFWKYAQGVIALPGGLGTFDEISECLAYMQTDVIAKRPLVLANQQFWNYMNNWLCETMELDYKTIDQTDLNLYKTCTTSEAIKTFLMEYTKML